MSARRLAGARHALAAAALVVSWSAPAGAQNVTVLQSTGDPSNRVDIAILGDGYSADEQAKFADDASRYLARFFAQQPWNEYRTLVNAYRIDVASPQSGASHPERGVFRATAFGASYNCGGVQRALCVDNSTVFTVVTRMLGPLQRDFLFVLVNDTEYGGTGGAVSVTSLDPNAVEIALHEIGHTLGLLADEYDSGPPPCSIGAFEPFAPNVTVQTSRDLIKWKAWIDASTPLPTTTPSAGVAGIYLGAAYCPTQAYRPTYNSKMRTLGPPYEQVNTEQIVRRFYNYVRPLDSFAPALSTVVVPLGGSTTFQVSTPALATHADVVTWSLDGVVVATGSALSVPAARLPPGPHTLTAAIHDPTPFVRSDPGRLLDASQSWTVSAGTNGGAPNPPTGLSASSFGSTVTLAWLAASDGGTPTGFVIEAGSETGLANLANFSTGTSATFFTTTGVAPGRYYVRVRSENSAGRSAASEEVPLSVGVGLVPDRPTNLAASASGSTVTLTWLPPASGAPPTEYIIDAGSAPGLSDLAMVATGSSFASFIASVVGSGRYYIRVRSANGAGRSMPSDEVLLTVGSGCGAAPTLSAHVDGSTVTLLWTTSAGASSYQIEAGSASGLSNLANLDTGNAQATFVATGVAANAYFVRVRANASCGRSGPSNEVVVTAR